MNLIPPPTTTRSFEKSAKPLSLTLNPSRLYLAAIVAFHALGLLALMQATAPALVRAALVLLVTLSLLYNLSMAVRRRHFIWHSGNRWTLQRFRREKQRSDNHPAAHQHDDSEYEEAKLLSVDFLSRWLVILTLKPVNGRAERVVIPFDSVAKDSYRLLRVRLRIEGHSLLNPTDPSEAE